MPTIVQRGMTVNNPEFLDKIQTTIPEKWNSLQPRERVMIVGAAIVIAIGVIFTVFNTIHKNIETQIAETENYRKALNYIADNQALYLQNKAKTEAIRTKLLEADAKVVSTLTSMASEHGFEGVTVTPKDVKKTSDDSGVEEQEIVINLQNVDYTKVLEYLVQIENLETPIYMRHINMKPTNKSSSATRMTVNITLISYRIKKDKNAT